MMSNIDKLIDSFVTGDYFIFFLAITLLILVVLIMALIKSREEYNELLNIEKNNLKNDLENGVTAKEVDILEELNLTAKDKEDEIDENKPLIKQIDTSSIIDNYEMGEEENAVISAEELEKKAQERLETLGVSENQEAIKQYEEEQENKAIISYEQLLKNASNFNLTYKDENKGLDAPRIQKVEVKEREISGPEIYLEEEEFLKILKEFRINMQ